MRSTIYDIAKVAEVSSSTVARVLGGVNKGLRKDSVERAARIREIAENLHYEPNLRARAFSQRRTQEVGLLFTDDGVLLEGANGRILDHLIRALCVQGFHLLLVPLGKRRGWESIIRGGHVDACVAFQLLPVDVRVSLQETGLPCVMLGDGSDPDLPHVVADEFAGAYAAVRHLISLGHERIGMYVHESSRPNGQGEERRHGFETAMHEAGLEPCFWQCPEYKMILELRPENERRPTALICNSEVEATVISHVLWQYGLKVPGDVSLIGFNDTMTSQFMTPPLTTIAYDSEQIGAQGAELVIRKIEGKTKEGPNLNVSDRVKVKMRVIVRGSTLSPVIRHNRSVRRA